MANVSIQQMQQLLRHLQPSIDRIVVLTGAGISAESGVPTFRGVDGLWRGMDPAELFTPEALQENPVLVWEMYDELRARIAAAAPNAGHDALVRLEQLRAVTLATQNIDGLHQRAGSVNVLELHGSLWRFRCDACGYVVANTTTPLPTLPPVCSSCPAWLRPDIVLFTESLPVDAYSQALQAVAHTDLMLVIGTSGVVYPAAGLPKVAHAYGAAVIEINPFETQLTTQVDYSIRATATAAVPAIVEALE